MATNATNSISVFALLDALRRRKLIVILPTLLLTAGFALYAYTQSTRYRAVASIAVAQTAPPEFLKHVAAAPVNIQDHLWTVREILFSPAVLESAAKEMKSYSTVEGKLPLQVLDEIKKSINLKVDGDHTFQIAYDATDRYEAMNVANKLAELFVEQASAKHEQKNQEAETVINDQISALKKHLESEGKRLEEYKAQ